jgi:uncharacterized protein (DUF736 family)
MTDYTNFIRFGENNTLTGNIASISYDLDITGEEFSSTNPKAPIYRLLAKSPRGRRVEIGGIWRKKHQNDRDYYTATITAFPSTPATAGSMPIWGAIPVRTTKT